MALEETGSESNGQQAIVNRPRILVTDWFIDHRHKLPRQELGLENHQPTTVDTPELEEGFPNGDASFSRSINGMTYVGAGANPDFFDSVHAVSNFFQVRDTDFSQSVDRTTLVYSPTCIPSL